MTPITWQAAVDDEEQRPLLQDILEAAVDDRRQAAVDVGEQRPQLQAIFEAAINGNFATNPIYIIIINLQRPQTDAQHTIAIPCLHYVHRAVKVQARGKIHMTHRDKLGRWILLMKSPGHPFYLRSKGQMSKCILFWFLKSRYEWTQRSSRIWE